MIIRFYLECLFKMVICKISYYALYVFGKGHFRIGIMIMEQIDIVCDLRYFGKVHYRSSVVKSNVARKSE